jgi:hypothetical protein
MDFSNKTYEELVRELNRLENKYDEISDECAEEGISYNEFCKRAHDVKKDIYFISKYVRLKKDAIVEFGKEWDANIYTIEQFISLVKNGGFVDSDGYGYYATDNGKSDIIIYPSDIIENIYRKDFTHIIWFNR